MGTHAMVGIWNSDNGTVTASYVHYDGYVEGVGRTLEEHFNDPIGAALVATGGYLSALYSDWAKSREESVHSDPATVFDSIEDYMKNGYDYAGAEYLYLYDGNIWFHASRHADRRFEEVQLNLAA
jgi:hypothetical protein